MKPSKAYRLKTIGMIGIYFLATIFIGTALFILLLLWTIPMVFSIKRFDKGSRIFMKAMKATENTNT